MNNSLITDNHYSIWVVCSCLCVFSTYFYYLLFLYYFIVVLFNLLFYLFYHILFQLLIALYCFLNVFSITFFLNLIVPALSILFVLVSLNSVCKAAINKVIIILLFLG